ncbi:MAG: saccharopine dehydrogenase NADP-binding domain-containing protein [Halobacteria archaeon]
MVRILVLGGAGEMGKRVVDELIQMSRAEVAIGDAREEAARQVAAKYPGRASALKVDALDTAGLAKAMGDADVSVNCVGPHYRFAVPIARAALKAGAVLTDICDDFEPAMELLAMDGEARKAKAAVVTGVGWTPGLSNLFARLGTEEVPGAREARIAWTGDGNAEGLAVIEHMLTIITGDVASYRDGKLVKVPAMGGAERLDFPEPVGRATVYDVGHPEPVTVPKFLPQLRTVTLKGGIVPAWSNGFLRLLASLGMTRTPEKRKRLSKRIHGLAHWGPFRRSLSKVTLSTLRVEVRGDGASKAYTAIDVMDRLTGIPCAVGALRLAAKRGEPGVFAPEGYFEPRPFLEEVARRGVKLGGL